jgi:uncharacterized protein (TIGR02757 family)
MKLISNLSPLECKELLDELSDRYNRPSFIGCDPISVPHSFNIKEDIELSAFLTAIISWGQRSQIIKKASLLMEMTDNAPFDFVVNSNDNEINRLATFYYRTFQFSDLEFFVKTLKSIYLQDGGLENLISAEYLKSGSLKEALILLFRKFECQPHQLRSMKHIANVAKGSSAKRLNMFLRWMVRSDNRGVDFGLWKQIPASALYIPLDVHSGRVARELKLLVRNQDDWKAVEELTNMLRKFDPTDPVKYDFALFGAGEDKTFYRR